MDKEIENCVKEIMKLQYKHNHEKEKEKMYNRALTRDEKTFRSHCHFKKESDWDE